MVALPKEANISIDISNVLTFLRQLLESREIVGPLKNTSTYQDHWFDSFRINMRHVVWALDYWVISMIISFGK